MSDNNIIKAEYFPTIPKKEIISTSKHRIPLKDLNTLGSEFAVIAGVIAEAAKNSANSEGLYRCVFPEGVTGQLAAFKDGLGFLGSIMNESGIARQARWLPVDGQSVFMSFDPVSLAIAVAMMNVSRKLDVIQETQEDILQFLQLDKESQVLADIKSLESTMDDYKFNSDNDLWKTSNLTNVIRITNRASANINFYKEQIANVLDKQNLLHGNLHADKIKSRLDENFGYYQLSIYLYAYSSLLQVMIGGNYKKDYLSSIIGRIKDYEYGYGVDYTNCYDELEHYMNSSIESRVLGGVGSAGKVVGGAIGKVPVINKVPVNEALLSAGNHIKSFSSRHSRNAMLDFKNNRDAGVQIFVESIESLNQVANSPVEVLFDNDSLYICQDPQLAMLS